MKYKRGTQAMLDAAKNDATLLPFDTVFITNHVKGISQHDMPTGVKATRKRDISTDSPASVAFEPFKNNMSYAVSDWWFCDTRDLLPAKKDKKPKQKKWQKRNTSGP